ncbi:MAG TPA: galactokinase [Solirubrobacteraceae bacterium]
MPREVQAFAPGRVNLIGEHTDYNGGLALPFAIAEGVTVSARATNERTSRAVSEESIRAHARDLAEDDEFALANPQHVAGWRAFVRGTAAELRATGAPIPAAELEIRGEVPRGAGLSSSAALEVALAVALLDLADAKLDRLALARLCSRVENDWVGARTGLLDQLASLFGEADTALCIDFSSLTIERVPLILRDGWRLVTVDSGERRQLAASGYNERRVECAYACELLGIGSLRELEGLDGGPSRALARLPARLARRARHVLHENERVLATVAALRAGDLPQVGRLLDASHTSLRDQYECSTPAVEAAVDRLRHSGAAGARMIGGGFGGHVLGLFAPDSRPPRGARAVHPSAGAHILRARA